MAYTFTEEVLYSTKFYIIDNNGQQVNVAYHPIEGNHYMMIIFAEDGGRIVSPHEQAFMDSLEDIRQSFDSGINNYVIIAL